MSDKIRKKANACFQGSWVRRGFFYVGLMALLAVILFPFYWQLLTSVKPPEQMWSIPPVWLPKQIYPGYYLSIFFKRNFLLYLKNSMIVSGCTTALAILVTSFAGYALARLTFKGKNIILALTLAVSMFPGIAIVSSLFLTMRSLHLLNTYVGLILTYTTITIPFAMWNLTSFFKTIPRELEEAAKVDGASAFYAFIHVIMPLVGPGIFTVAILVFITAWNEFLYALTFNTQETMRTVTVGIAMFPGEFELPWGDMAAASVVVTIPLILLVLICQRRIISGITAGAVKG